MVDGQTGKPGAVVVKRAVAENKHACAHVPILHQVWAVLIVQEAILSPNLAIQMDVKVRKSVSE